MDLEPPLRRDRAALLWLGLAAALRFSALDRPSFWLDEAWTLAFARLPFPDCLFADANMPPLFVLLLHGWLHVVGTGSDAGLRCLPAALSVLGCAAFWCFARALLPRQAALCALALLALDPLHLYFAQELRSYALLSLTFTLALHAHLRELEPGAPRRRVTALAIALVAGLYSHYLFGFAALAIGVHRLARLRREPKLAARRLAPLAIAALLFAPWVLWLAQVAPPQERGYTTDLWKQIESLPHLLLLGDAALVSLPTSLAGAQLYEWLCIPLFGLVATPLLAGGCIALATRGPSTRFVLCAAFLPLLALAALFAWIPLFTSRYLSFLAPIACLLAGAGASWIAGRFPRLARVAIAALLALQAGALVRYYFDEGYGREDWRGAAAWVAERSSAEDRLLFEAPYVREAFARYYGGAGISIEVPEREPAREAAIAAARSSASTRVFLVRSHTARTSATALAEWSERYSLRERKEFPHGNGIEVLRLERRP